MLRVLVNWIYSLIHYEYLDARHIILVVTGPHIYKRRRLETT